MSISVLIPTYNASRTIKRTLDSVFSQSRLPDEVIVLDDGSLDNTLEIVRDYKTGPLQIHEQQNSGAASARNHAARLANGKYLAFLDADDVWHPTKLEKQLKVMTKHGDANVCWCDSVQTTEELLTKTIEETIVQTNSEILATRVSTESVILEPYWGTPNVMMTAELFDKLNGFDETLETAEDVDLWMRATLFGTAYHLRDTLTYVITQPDSLTMTRGRDIFINHLRALKKVEQLSPEFKVQYRQAASRVRELWGSALLCEQQFLKARKILLQSLRGQIRKRNLYLFAKALYLQISRKQYS